jgi:predicted nucleic acid-binding protein
MILRGCHNDLTKSYYEHARIWADIEAAGKMAGYYDLIVAATAIERGSRVATFNRRHFESISGLAVLEPK